MLPVAGGTAAGETRLVKSGTGRIVSLGFDDAGRYYYGMHSRVSDIFTARLDPQTGRVLSAASRAIERFEGLNEQPYYSRDGARMAYVSARGSLTGVLPRFNVLCIRALDAGEDREFHTGFRRLGGPRFSPDGTAVFVATCDDDNRWGIQRVDVTTGAFSPVVQARPGRQFSDHALSPDGRFLFYAWCDHGEGCGILSRNLADGSETEIHRGPREPLRIALSPDGKRLAFVSLPLDSVRADRVVRVVPVTGGTPREVYRFTEDGQHWNPPEFSADGKFLFVPRELATPEDPYWTVLRVPVEGGEPRDLGLKMIGFGHIAAHPGGERIAFSSEGVEDKQDEVWVVEGFLPETVAKR
jgi:dipeptidyl aminopeptidase/acylaminoacyl peptidase